MKHFHAGSHRSFSYLGPLPVSKKGNQFLCIDDGIDQFAKRAECVPLPNQSADTTAKAVNEFL